MDNDKVNNLKRELKELLEKYNVSIQFGFNDSTDTHGIHGERIEIVENGTNKVVLSNRGFDMTVHDIK